MNATRKKIRLTLEIEVTAPVGEDHERAAWTAAIGVTPTVPGVAFGPADVVGIETEDEPCQEPEVEVIRSLADETPTKKQPGTPLMPCHTGALGGVSEPAESRQLGLTVPVVCQFGTAFGLWGYNLDFMLNGKGQGDHPDLIAVEESDIYAAVARAIEAQDAPRLVRREVAGARVLVEEKPSELYAVLRHAMFEAYRRAPEFPDRP